MSRVSNIIRLRKILKGKFLRQIILKVMPLWVYTPLKRLLRKPSIRSIDLNSAVGSKEAQRLLKTLYSNGAILAFGSLLGAIREGKLLRHDTDMDFIFPGDLDSIEETLGNDFGQEWRFLRRGYILNLTSLNSGLSVDLFQAYRTSDKSHVATFACGKEVAMYMFPSTTVFPARELKISAGTFLVPFKPDEFLALHYGPGWTRYDPTWTYASAPSRVPLARVSDIAI